MGPTSGKMVVFGLVLPLLGLAACEPDPPVDPPVTTTTTIPSSTTSSSPKPSTTTTVTTVPTTTTTTTRPTSTVRTTVRSGNWSDAGVWNTGRVPAAGDAVTLAHNVIYDMASGQVAGLTINAGSELAFDRTKTRTLLSNANVMVEGVLRMRPASADVQHTLRFVGINEEAFVGGGMQPLASDVGLWVMGAGQLDLVGTTKTAWVRLTNTAAAGATTVTLTAAPLGWQVGDEVSITPTDSPKSGSASWSGFDDRTVTAISSNTVMLDRPLSFSHPKVNGKWTAEVMNLTRNVRVEGTGDGSLDPLKNGRAHVFVHSTKQQFIKYAAIRHTGPRPQYVPKNRPVGAEPKWPSKMETFGRYGLHFHMNGDASRGSEVEGTVVRDAGNHAYVPHLSHGISFRNTISYNTTNDAYWWDGPTLPHGGLDTWRQFHKEADPTHDTLYEGAIAAKVKTGGNNVRINGFELGLGDRNVVRNSVAVGVQGGTSSSGYEWPEAAVGVWGFFNNLSHNNNAAGIFGWQNTGLDHVINDFDAYYNTMGIEHGAYSNHYLYRGGTLYGSARTGILLHASSSGPPGLRFEDIVIDGAAVSPSAVETTRHQNSSANPTVFRNITMRGHTGSGAVLVNTSGTNLDRMDFVNPRIEGNAFFFRLTPAASVIRVQDKNGAYTLTPTSGAVFVPEWNAWKTPIPPFSP